MIFALFIDRDGNQAFTKDPGRHTWAMTQLRRIPMSFDEQTETGLDESAAVERRFYRKRWRLIERGGIQHDWVIYAEDDEESDHVNAWSIEAWRNRHLGLKHLAEQWRREDRYVERLGATHGLQ